MYNQHLRVYGEHLAKNQALPKNSNVVGNGGFQRAGSTMGAVEIIVQAAEKVSIGANKNISVFMEISDDQQTVETSPYNFKFLNGSTVRSWEAGETIAKLGLPSDSKRFVRLVFSTDDTTASGSVDAGFDYLPR